jgi:hypothetical protein
LAIIEEVVINSEFVTIGVPSARMSASVGFLEFVDTSSTFFVAAVNSACVPVVAFLLFATARYPEVLVNVATGLFTSVSWFALFAQVLYAASVAL